MRNLTTAAIELSIPNQEIFSSVGGPPSHNISLPDLIFTLFQLVRPVIYHLNGFLFCLLANTTCELTCMLISLKQASKEHKSVENQHQIELVVGYFQTKLKFRGKLGPSSR